MNLLLTQITEADLAQYKKDMQEAFLLGAIEGGFPEDTGEVLPEADIDRSMSARDAVAYKAVQDGEMVGGAIIVIDEKKHSGHLDFLYVKHGIQGKGIGKFIWFEIEKLYPDIRVWETCTPYFEKRNLHFYVNVCRFQVVDYWNERHPDPNDPYDHAEHGEVGGMFGFRKEMHVRHRNPTLSHPIETERLVIRGFKEKDFDAYYRLVVSPRVNCFRDMAYKSTAEAKEAFADKLKSNDVCDLAVVLKDTDEFIGTIFGGLEGEYTYDICWNFLPEFGGKGYAYEAASAFCEFLFTELNVRRISAYTEDVNIPSQKLCERLGMRREGLFKEFISFVDNEDGTPHYENTYTWAILKKEWQR